MSKLVRLPASCPNPLPIHKHEANSHSSHKDIGANASAEEGAEELDDTKVKVNNIVASFRLQSTQFDKKGYLTYLKGTIDTQGYKVVPISPLLTSIQAT